MEDTEGKITPRISMSVIVLVSTLFLGGVLFVIGYIVSRLSRSNKPSDSIKNGTESEKVKFEDSRDLTSGSTGTAGSSSNKRAKNKKRREMQQEFTHSWMVGVLKGHTGPVLDMNFSSNGRFLASCAEDCGLGPEEEVLDPGETDQYNNCQANHETSGSTKGSNSKSPSSTSALATITASDGPSATSDGANSTTTSSSTKEDRAILSRRQRKNRTRTPRDQRRELRDDEHEDEQSSQQQQRHRRHVHCRDSETSEIKSTARKNSCSRRIQIQNDPHDEENKNNSEPGTNANGSLRKSRGIFPSTQRRELQHLSDAALASLLRRYTLTGEQLAHLGYPVEYSYFPGYAVIINHYQHPMGHRARGYHHLDANAQEFVPGGSSAMWPVESEGDSGHCSGSSVENSDLEQESASDSDKSSDIGESSSSTDSSSSSFSSSDCSYQEQSRRDPARDFYEPILVVDERKCARCYRVFYVNQNNGEYLYHEPCVYHWGKLRSGLVAGTHCDTWECCRGRDNAQGCTIARMHVWTGLAPGYNGPFDGYVRTRLARTVPTDGNYGVYALDCEMCFTRHGLELAKVTVVGIDGKVVYDTLVKPDTEVIDYNTRFSGITAKDLAKATKTLRDVQRDLTSFVHAETILIGHGLENDLRALRLLHTTVIDTCVAFPHFLGYPFRSSLKTLARTVLRREIQVKGHDSVEDARIVMDLMLRKLQHDIS
ncbi:uncharacterized protein LOC117207080 [Bombus bifarius]|uniref:Uncharacterized protein LOC117207080 n=1 Tax=Bombus bifarius TaxID=103933 RepID=A0A6P8LWN2_9HYME|nr:uncharacterized protein LOC117207080 [Bombus bifarius]XP_033302824.1 uncharacterized protein LOC117207080 [Bombus bifarius]